MITLLDAVRTYAEDPRGESLAAVRSGGNKTSFRALWHLTELTAARLATLGVAPGDRILISLSNTLEHLLAVLAAMRLGATAVPIHHPCGAKRLGAVIASCRPCLQVTEDAESSSSLVRNVRLVADVGTGAVDLVADSKISSGRSASHAGGPAFVRFTSGSTGAPKGVVIGHAQQTSTAATLAAVFGLGPRHRELVVAPMALSGGWQRVAATLWAGGCVVLTRSLLSPSMIFEQMEEHQITGTYLPPPLARALLVASSSGAQSGLAHCRVLEIGSASILSHELESLASAFPNAKIYVHYGLTECSRATLLDYRSHREKGGTVGRPGPGVQLEVRDEDNRCLPSGAIGEIHLRGPQLAAGYWCQPELTRRFFRGGWFATGDYGRLDEDGFLVYSGRNDDCLSVGGFKFFPDEVEAELARLPGAAQFVVAPVVDAAGLPEKAPWLFVVPRNVEQWSEIEALRHARRRLPPYMVPKRIIVVPELPLTHSGKPDRRQTVSRYVASQGPDSSRPS